MQVSATLLFLLLPLVLLPFVLLFALLVLCAVDTSWHVAKSPGHLSARSIVLPTLRSSTDGSLVQSGPLLPARHFSRCLTAKGRSQPASQLVRLR